MADENNNPDDSSDTGPEGPVAGERLAEARREQQIPVIEIAKELHLDEHKVRALESNDFEVIGAPVFAKGHLRKYAQLVNVDEADVMADYYQLTRSAAAPPVIPRRPRQRKVLALGPWVAAIIVIVVAATAYWWFAEREVAPVRPVVGLVAPLPQDIEAEASEDAAADDADESVDEPVVDSSDANQVPIVEAEPVAVVREQNTDTQISITYSGDCWTEISDANGRRLFFDLGKAGRTVDLSGEAPFNVLFGNAENVSIELNGASFEIPAADRRGRTARLTINGS